MHFLFPRNEPPCQLAGRRALSAITLILLLTACTHTAMPLFEPLSPSRTGIDFVNQVEDTDSLGILDYLYFYNGGGVAVGDINNDGLPDIYFTANKGSNKLYLNKGNFQFEDITARAGVAGNADWTTGVTMADVNGDGWLDIYVCTVGGYLGLQSTNQLFINNRNGTFTESAARWGINETGFCTQAVFFDYDKDGDLDMYLLKHSIHSNANYTDTTIRRVISRDAGDQLFRNEGDHFVEVTQDAGIYSSAIGYGLGVAVADMNNDGWPDLYISNDFHENDYYYLNNGNGTFREVNTTAFGHESRFSMGSDIADVNNDGWPDIMTLDMLAEDEQVLKSSGGDDPLDIYNYKKSFGYHYQYSRNCLQLNTGAGNHFSDIALYSGVAATDWSWCPLMADFDNDGRKDIFVSTGIVRRPNDMDYIKYLDNGQLQKSMRTSHKLDKTVLEKMPAGKWHNYLFQGTDSLVFNDRSVDWGMGEMGWSNGAAYADLDNDGDLDLIVNNINAPASMYRNNARKINKHHYLKITFKGSGGNTDGIGAKVAVKTAGGTQHAYHMLTRGFESSVAPGLLFGLGHEKIIDSLEVVWPDNTVQLLTHINTNQTLVLFQVAAKAGVPVLTPGGKQVSPIFVNITDSIALDYQHKENGFIDFNRQLFIPHQHSTTGPQLTVGDINGDGLDDFYIGGARRQAGRLYMQQANGSFTSVADELFDLDAGSEDVAALFVDVNGDKKPDLYVVSGGNEFWGNAAELLDRLYINDGEGRFHKSSALPALYGNKSVVCAADIDKDGDMDLFVGGRVHSQQYGTIPESYLLENDGKGNFTIVTPQRAPAVRYAGMVTTATWADIDNDGWPDLLVAGEWMPLKVFHNVKGKLVEGTANTGQQDYTGWWQSMKAVDLNGDGAVDIVLGNWGTNSKLKASIPYPLKMYLADLDGNTIQDQILSCEHNGKYYTFLGKEELEKQLPSIIRKKYTTYKSFAGQTVEQVFGHRLDTAKKLQATTLQSAVLWNDKQGKFIRKALPAPAQWSPMMAIYAGDVNMDGHKDLITGGNFYGVLPYEGRYDAQAGGVLLGDGKGGWNALSTEQSGWEVSGEVRDVKMLRTVNGQQLYVVSRNNDGLLFFTRNH
jgi:hypothetical protein